MMRPDLSHRTEGVLGIKFLYIRKLKGRELKTGLYLKLFLNIKSDFQIFFGFDFTNQKIVQFKNDGHF